MDEQTQLDAPEAGGPVQVLVVDDDPGIQGILRWALEDAGFAVTTAADGQEALAQVARQRPALVVLDLTLPLLDGVGVAAGLRTLHDGAIPIVVISADSNAGAKARQAGAASYLRKPFDLEDFITAVRRALDGG